MSFLRHIRACNAHDLSAYRPFILAGERIGWVKPGFAQRLLNFSDVFQGGPDRVEFSSSLTTPEARNRAIGRVTEALAASGDLPPPKGEDYAIASDWGRPTLFLLDRAQVSFFGCKAFGLHVNGFVRDGKRHKLWIGRRALDKPVAPGKLDNMVAGGQPARLTLAENLLKEAAEEADIPAALAATAQPVGALRYCLEGRHGLKPDTMFLYDLEVPPDFTPRNTDGEMIDFTLMEIEEVMERIRSTDDFKFNVNLVIIDFLIRHGYLSPDLEPDYMEIVTGLRVRF